VVYLAGDSIAICSDDFSSTAIEDPKVFVKNGIGFGLAGSSRACQLVKYHFNVPKMSKSQDVMAYLTVDLIGGIKKLFIDEGIVKNFGEMMDENLLMGLLAHEGKLYYVDADFSIDRSVLGFYALGAGGSVALGALDALMQTAEMKPEQALVKALEIAARHNSGLRPPFNVVSVKGRSSRNIQAKKITT
jgi:ATP-dependent protease HslVU (ClpYQ) peptidase subunit